MTPLKDPEKRKQYEKEYARKDPEKRQEINRRWKARNPERQNQYNERWKAKNKPKVLEYAKRHKDAHPEQVRAVAAAQKLPRGRCCERCASTVNLQKHHPDYSRPRQFITLCVKCHRKLHNAAVS
jgi:hypothetical protein